MFINYINMNVSWKHDAVHDLGIWITNETIDEVIIYAPSVYFYIIGRIGSGFIFIKLSLP